MNKNSPDRHGARRDSGSLIPQDPKPVGLPQPGSMGTPASAKAMVPGAAGDSLLPATYTMGVYDFLRVLILNLCLLRRRVEEEMIDLSLEYRKTMPPTRLQLYHWNYPKGSPRRALHWVRLCKKQNTVNHDLLQIRGPKRPRWCTRLKIRCWSDLGNHIYWNGLVQEVAGVKRFYERACSLNKAHRCLAMRPPHLLQTLRRKGVGVDDVQHVPRERMDDRDLQYLLGAGGRLLEDSLKLEWALETDLDLYGRVAGLTPKSKIRLRILRNSKWEFVRFAWIDPGSGREATSPSEFLSSGSLEPSLGLSLAPETSQELQQLAERIDGRVELIQDIQKRLSEIASSAEATLDPGKSSRTGEV